MAIRLRLHPRYQRLKTKQLRNTPVTLYRDYTELARRCEISQSAVGSPKNAENRCILFSIFTPWISHGVPTAIVAFLRRFLGVLSRSCGVLVGDRLRAHGVLMACPRRAHRVLGAVTARARRAHDARTASTPFTPFRLSIRIMLCLPAIVHVMSHSHQHSYIMLSCQGTEPAAELKYNFRYSRCFFATVLSRLEPLLLSTSYMKEAEWSSYRSSYISR